MRAIRPLLFRIFYSTSFTIAFLIVVALIVLTLSDAVYQSWQEQRQWDIGVIVGTYVLTALLAFLIYASRLYTNRSILQGIPKTHVPVEKEDLPGKQVRKEIVEGLERSAIIAYKARPRFEQTDDESPTASARISARTQSDTKREDQAIWSTIAHPGWSSPASPDLPNLHYQTVIAELPGLIEAKAVSLAPVITFPPPEPDEILLPDERIVEILQRPLNMGLRDYVIYLDSLELINPQTLIADFLLLYERARFSTKPLSEPDFRTLMGIFASILRGMTKLNPDHLSELERNNANDLPAAWWTPNAGSPKTASTFSIGHDHGSSSSLRHFEDKPPPRRVSEDSVPSLPTEEEDNNSGNEAEEDPKSQDPLQHPSHHPSSSPPPPSALRQPQPHSTPSLASRTSTRSDTAGSVIRLTEARTLLDLPYVID